MLILFGVDLNLGLPICGRLPDFSDRKHDDEPGADAVLTEKELAIDVSLYTLSPDFVCPFFRENPHFAGVF
jgi:hypothetical protein